MAATTKIKTPATLFKTILSTIKKLSAEEKQLLRLKVFGDDALEAMKEFDQQLKKQKPLVRKTDAQVVSLTNAIRKKKHAHT